MELRTLRYFFEIARNENMTRALEALHVSRPSLSKEMKSLEDELGKKIFMRKSGGLIMILSIKIDTIPSLKWKDIIF